MAFVPKWIEGFEGKHRYDQASTKRTRFSNTTGNLSFDDDNGYHSPTALKVDVASSAGSIGLHSIGTAGWWQGNATFGAVCFHIKFESLPTSGLYAHVARWQRSGGTQHQRLRVASNGDVSIAYNTSWRAKFLTIAEDIWYLFVIKSSSDVGFEVEIYNADEDTRLGGDIDGTLKASNMYNIDIGAEPSSTSTGTYYIDNVVADTAGGNGIDPYDDYLLTTMYTIDTLHATGEGTDQAHDSGVWTDVDDVGEPDMGTTIVTFANSGGDRKYSVTLENHTALYDVANDIMAVQSDVNIREHQGGAAGYVNFIEGVNRFKTAEMGWDTSLVNYDTCQLVRTLAPDGSAWDNALLNNLEIGWEIKGTTGDVTYGTALRVSVLYKFTSGEGATGRASSFFF